MTSSVTSAAPGEIRGTAFFDENSDGQWDTNFELTGVQGVTIVAYDGDGLEVATDTTDAAGNYQLVGIPGGQRLRIEATAWPSPFVPGPQGDDDVANGIWGGETTVTFASENDEHVDIGFVSPAQFCNSNPILATPCYAFGNRDDIDDTIAGTVGVPFGAQGASPEKTWLTPANQIGSVYGAAWSQPTSPTDPGDLITTSFLKRHVDLGPGLAPDSRTTGGFYRIVQGAGDDATGTLWLDLDAETPINTGGDPRSFMTNPATPGLCPSGPTGDAALNCWLTDDDTFTEVGRRGLGDTNFSPDRTSLFTVNLFNRSLVEVPVTGAPIVPDIPAITEYSFSSAEFADCAQPGDWRPFALGSDDVNGMMYLGVTCSGETTFNAQGPGSTADRVLGTAGLQARSELAALVYRFDPASPGDLTLVLEEPLDYRREGICFSPTGCDYWNPWSELPSDYFGPPNLRSRATPLVSDIQVDGNNLVIGLRDLYGDVSGHFAFDPGATTGDPAFQVVTYGDILKACSAAPLGTLTLEANGSCGSTTGDGAGNGFQGPPGDTGAEFFNDNWSGAIGIPENSTGAIALIQSRADGLVSTGNHVNELPSSAGLIRLNPDTGAFTTPGAQIFATSASPPPDPVGGTFAKANGLGALAPLCTAAPLEIGNYVWFDVDRDGVQDPDEAPVVGATVNLYLAGETTPVATTQTDATGEYYFRSTDQAYQLLANETYRIAIDNPSDYDDPGGPLHGWTPTIANTGNGSLPDQNDSDGVVPAGGRFPELQVTTGGSGSNDHTLDFGFSQTGGLDVVKLVTGDTGAILDPANTTFVVTVACRFGGQVWTPILTVDSAPATSPVTLREGQTLRVDGVAAGGECTLEELPPTGGLSPGAVWLPGLFSGAGVSPPANPATVSISAGVPASFETVTLTNRVEQRLGSFTVTKTVSPAAADPGVGFDVAYECVLDPLPTISGVVTVRHEATVRVDDIPENMVCTFSEPTRADPAAGWMWSGNPTIFPTSITVGAGSVLVVNVTNFATLTPTTTLPPPPTVPPTSPPPTGTLPRTGSESGSMVPVGVGFLLVGAAALGLSRRRRFI